MQHKRGRIWTWASYISPKLRKRNQLSNSDSDDD